MGVWERSPAGVAPRARHPPTRWRRSAPPSPDLDDADVIGSAYCIRRYEVDARFGGRRGSRRRPGRARRARACVCSSTSCPTTWLPITRGSPSTPSTSSRATPTTSPRASGLPRGRRRGHRPRPRPVLPAVAGRRPAQRLRARPAPGRGRHAARHRRSGRRRPLRHGDAAAQRRVRPHVGRARRRRAGAGVLDRGDRCGPSRAPGLRVRRRGVLGSRVAAAAARVRLLLRQAALRPAAPRGRRRRCAATSAPTSTTNVAWCASSRTTTSRAPPPSSHRRRSGPRPSSSPRCPARRCGTRASSKAGGCGSRCSSAAGRPSRSTRSSRRFHLELIGATAPRAAWRLGIVRRRAAGRTTPAPTQLLAWSWIDDEQRSLIVINFADAPAAARIHPPWNDLAERTWRLDDLLSDRVYRTRRDGDRDRWALRPAGARGSSTSSHGPTRPASTPDHRPIGCCSDVPAATAA